jgi:hypothetical protein
MTSPIDTQDDFMKQGCTRFDSLYFDMVRKTSKDNNGEHG